MSRVTSGAGCSEKLDLLNACISARGLAYSSSESTGEAATAISDGFYSIRVNQQYRIIFRFRRWSTAKMFVVPIITEDGSRASQRKRMLPEFPHRNSSRHDSGRGVPATHCDSLRPSLRARFASP